MKKLGVIKLLLIVGCFLLNNVAYFFSGRRLKKITLKKERISLTLLLNIIQKINPMPFISIWFVGPLFNSKMLHVYYNSYCIKFIIV